MLRGVNKKIIEINNVDGGYFEKILFFVSDDRRSEPDSVLENQAQKYANDSCALKMAISAGIGLAVGILLL